MASRVAYSALKPLVDAGKITPQQIADKVKAGEIEIVDDSASMSAPAGPRPQPSEAASEPALMSRANAVAEKVAPAVDPVNISTGIVKGAVDTAYNIGRGVVNIIKGRPADTSMNPDFEAALQPQNAGEKVGKFVERGAEFAGGEGAVGVLAKSTGLLARVVKGAAAGAVVTKAQGGSDTEATVNAGLGGVLGPVLEGAGAGMKWLGEKLQASHIRGGLADEAAGFSVGTLNKYGLSGYSLRGTLKAVHDKITSLAGELRAVTKNTVGDVDLTDTLAKAETNLLSRASRLSNAGDVEGIKSAIDKFTNEAADLGGKVTIDEAQTLKRSVGLRGAWAHGKSDADTALEAVANEYANQLKSAIEVSAPKGTVAAINKQLGELMPIERAIIRRLPVEARSAPLSLADIALLAAGHPVAALAHIGSKTMAGATVTHAAGNAIQKAAATITRAAQAANSGTH